MHIADTTDDKRYKYVYYLNGKIKRKHIEGKPKNGERKKNAFGSVVEKVNS